jgi:hypothetical protein
MKRGKIPFFNVPRCDKKGDVCFYFFEKLKIFQKNKNKPSFPVAAWHIKQFSKSRILPRFMYILIINISLYDDLKSNNKLL